MQNVVPPFGLGETLSGTDDNDNLINQSILGQIHEFPANRLDAGGVGQKTGRKTGRTIKAIALRNVSGQTLYGKRLAALRLADEDTYGAGDGAPLYHEVDGYTTDTGQKNFVIIDEYLEDNGVADDDIFWGILEGPVTVKSQAFEAADVDMTYGQAVAAGTAGATSGQTTAGGVCQHTCDEAGHLVGKACTSFDETGNTFSDIPIVACISYI